MDERDYALARATLELNKRAKFANEYRRGFNDCLAFLFIYDEYLRGHSKARDYINFEWKTTRGFFIQMARHQKSLTEFAKHAEYEILRNEKPILGDIAFTERAMIYSYDNWLTTNEDNTGVDIAQDVDHLIFHARPFRSE